MSPDRPLPDTLPALIAASTHRDELAIAISCPGRRDLTYGDLCRLLGATHAALGRLDIPPAHRIATLIPHGPQALTVPLALACCGVRVIPIDAALPPAALEEVFVRMNVEAVVVGTAIEAGLPDNLFPDRILLEATRGEPAGWFTLTDTGGDAVTRVPFIPSRDDVAFVFQTSGTTAEPKSVPLSHGNIHHASMALARSLALSSSDITAAVMPLDHVHGLIASGFASLAVGARVVCPLSIGSSGFMDVCRHARPTWYSAAPAIHSDILLNHAGPVQATGDPPLRFIRSCSAPLDPQLARRLEDCFHAPVIEAYGMTEASHQICSNPLPPGRRKPGSVGCSQALRVAIVDADEHEQPEGVTGEVVIQGSTVTNGYESRVGSQRKSEGWFHTGDLGYLDKDGYLFLIGRIKEQINRGGSMISPLRVESVLRQHPTVTDAAVFAVKHATLGENVAAALVTTGNTSDRDIRAFASARLPRDHVPARIVLVDEIPAGPTGKVRRSRLADTLATPPSGKLSGQFSGVAEEILAGIWATRLDTTLIRPDSHFFDSGGDSLSGFHMVNQLNERFGIRLTISDLFDSPVLSDLAQRVSASILARISAMTEGEARAELSMLNRCTGGQRRSLS